MPLKYLQSAQQSFDAVLCAVSATYKMYKYTPTHAVYKHMHGKDNKRGEHMSRIVCILFSVHFLASIQPFVVRSRSVYFIFWSIQFPQHSFYIVHQDSEFPFASQQFAHESVFRSASNQSNVQQQQRT